LVAMAWREDAELQIDAKHEQDIKNDVELGKKYSAEADKELKASKDAEALKRLQRIGAEIADIANRTAAKTTWGDKRFSRFDYTFKLVEGKDVNAFSLPGGYIYFYEGMLKYVESDDELAGVVAHEIAHASLRHVATLQREQSKLNAIQLPLILVAILASAQGSNSAADVLGVSQLIGAAAGSGWSVRAEQAADYAGFQYMVKSKYDATGMLTMMERLAKDERNGPSIDWGIYRSHPPSRQRADSLTKYMVAANVPIRRSTVTTSYRATVKPGDDQTVQVLFGGRKIVALGGTDALKRADDIANRLNSFFDSGPDLFEITNGDDGIILGRRQPLFRLTPADAQASKTSVEELKREALRNLKTAAFGLAYKVWDTR